MQYSETCFFSFNMLPSFIQIVIWAVANSILLLYIKYFCANISQFIIHFPVSRHWSCFHYFPIMNSTDKIVLYMSSGACLLYTLTLTYTYIHILKSNFWVIEYMKIQFYKIILNYF